MDTLKEKERSQMMAASMAVRHACFILLWVLSVILFWKPLSALISLSFQDERYSYLALIPFISAYLIYVDWKGFQPRYCPRAALFLPLGMILHYAAKAWFPAAGLSGAIFAMLVMWAAAFLLCYGMDAWNAARFPLLFLALMIPPPESAMEKATYFLQKASAEVTYVLFRILDIPVFRQGFLFSLPGVDIEVAEQCSGIRSSMALFITSILAGRVFLRSGRNRLWLSLLTIPIVIFKNAVRITGIVLLGVYVNREFLYGRLHQYGGLPFSLVALGILVPLLLALRKSEGRPLEQRG